MALVRRFLRCTLTSLCVAGMVFTIVFWIHDLAAGDTALYIRGSHSVVGWIGSGLSARCSAGAMRFRCSSSTHVAGGERVVALGTMRPWVRMSVIPSSERNSLWQEKYGPETVYWRIPYLFEVAKNESYLTLRTMHTPDPTGYAIALPGGLELDTPLKVHQWGVHVTLPAWLVLLLFGAYPLWRARGWVRRWRRRRQGLCVECGYDLRASPERCPECGAGVRSGGVKAAGVG